MSKGRDQTVFQRDGEWFNKRNDTGKVSSRHDTQGEAETAAREMLRNQGGGELTIQGENGRFRSKDTINQVMTHAHRETGSTSRQLPGKNLRDSSRQWETITKGIRS